MIVSLEKLAEYTDSTIQGDKKTELSSVATLEDATAGQISFLSNPKYINLLGITKASAVILSPDLAEGFKGNALVNKNPYLTFAKVLSIIHKEKSTTYQVHPSAIVADDAVIDNNVSIGANVVIESGVTIRAGTIIGAGSYIGENSFIAQNTKLYPHVSIYSDSKIGRDTIIHSGAVIGSDGFGFAQQEDKSWFKIIQIGNVVIGDNVEIGANTTIDRAALGTTLISNGVKLDNQIQIAHNVRIGENTAIAAGTVIAGSSCIGKRCQIGGASALSGHLNITDDVIITGKSMVINSIKKPGVYSSGIASDENKKWRRNAARFRQLDEMAKKINRLEKKNNG